MKCIFFVHTTWCEVIFWYEQSPIFRKFSDDTMWYHLNLCFFLIDGTRSNQTTTSHQWCGRSGRESHDCKTNNDEGNLVHTTRSPDPRVCQSPRRDPQFSSFARGPVFDLLFFTGTYPCTTENPLSPHFYEDTLPGHDVTMTRQRRDNDTTMTGQ
jgi:hypothetical protein